MSVDGNKKKKNTACEAAEHTPNKGTAQSVSLPSQPRVLVAEDDPISARLLLHALESIGMPAAHATTGKEALRLFRSNEFRVVISDWMMPEMEGTVLCREIRKLTRPYVYVILLTSRDNRADRAEAFEAGVDDIMAKPLDREELFAKLKVADRILASEDRLQTQKAELEVARERLLIANQNLSVASRRFEELFHKVPVACFTFDQDGLVHEWNRNSEVLFGVPAHLSYQQPIWDVLECSEDSIWSERSVRGALNGAFVEAREWTFEGAGGVRYLVCNIFPLTGPSGEILGAISANVDITERKLAEQRVEEQKSELEAANSRLSRLALTDGLTGLLNHRAFHEALETARVMADENGNTLSLAMVDVDMFKQYNDTYGHPAGDEVLKKVAQLLAQSCGDTHIPARYGGEEFAIIMPDMDVESASLAAEVMRQKIAEANWPKSQVTVSIGVATMPQAAGSITELIADADQALYASKHAGRNRVTHRKDVRSQERENTPKAA